MRSWYVDIDSAAERTLHFEQVRASSNFDQPGFGSRKPPRKNRRNNQASHRKNDMIIIRCIAESWYQLRSPQRKTGYLSVESRPLRTASSARNQSSSALPSWPSRARKN